MDSFDGPWYQPSFPDVAQLHDERRANEHWTASSPAVGHAPTQAIDMRELAMTDSLQPSELPFPYISLLFSYPHLANPSNPQHYYLYNNNIPQNPQTFQTLPFSSPTWMSPTPQLPLSSYSSLNGATSSSGSNQQSPSTSTPPVQSMIECVHPIFSSLNRIHAQL